MTKEEAIAKLTNMMNHCYPNEEYKMAIKALEQKSCGDAISRDKAIVQLSHLLSDWDDDWNVGIRKCIETVKSMKSIIPQPKTGYWEWVQYDGNPNIGNWHCSECRSIVIECVSKEKKGGIPLYKYCPQCGAKIE